MMVVLSEHSLKETEGFEQVFNVSKIYVHNYHFYTFNNDIMLIKVCTDRGGFGSQSSSAMYQWWLCFICV